MRIFNIRFLFIMSIVSVAFFSASCMGPVGKTMQKYPGFSYVRAPETPLPLSTKDLPSGLSVIYYYYMEGARSLDSLPDTDELIKAGAPGPPINNLDNKFENNDIFQSGAHREMGLEMSGYIKLDKPGTYLFQANTNDGFRLYIDNTLLIDDPLYHSDRLSPESAFNVKEPAWYPLKIRYFQRKGTATLQLFWKPPGENKFSIVPAEVLAHPKS